MLEVLETADTSEVVATYLGPWKGAGAVEAKMSAVVELGIAQTIPRRCSTLQDPS